MLNSAQGERAGRQASGVAGATAEDKFRALKRPVFAEAMARAKTRQKQLILEGGMAGAYSSQLAVLGVKNLLGWKEQVESVAAHTLKGPTQEQLDEIYRVGKIAADKFNKRTGE